VKLSAFFENPQRRMKRWICLVLLIPNLAFAGNWGENWGTMIWGIAPEIPSAPQITSIEPGNGQVSISVSVADNGDSPITSYSAYCIGSTGYHLGTSPTSPITVSGLANGVSYVCLVTATNDGGTSPASALSEPVTPVAPPPGC
jgi:hypothetical protein